MQKGGWERGADETEGRESAAIDLIPILHGILSQSLKELPDRAATYLVVYILGSHRQSWRALLQLK